MQLPILPMRQLLDKQAIEMPTAIPVLAAVLSADQQKRSPFKY
jgi:hypothetical protein